MSASWREILKKRSDYLWEIPQDYKDGMQVPGLIFASEVMLGQMGQDNAFEQVANVACLPGIVGYSMAMPDIHWGYGFPIGGVAATRTRDGVVSPGGVGFDINCGIRLLRTNLTEEEVRPRIKELVGELFAAVPSGLGSTGRLRLSQKELEEVMVQGSRWAVSRGYGEAEDVTVTEEEGAIQGANPDKVSLLAKKRGLPQLGTLGSGNHFLEVQVVAEIYDQEAARVMGINQPGQVLVLIHTGSRGFGHQVCTDYVRLLGEATRKYGISLPDRQLACAPIKSPEGRDYLEAMAAAANYAWTNRQCIAHWTRESLSRVFGKSRRELGLGQVYDVAHNIAKIEEHTMEGKKEPVCVHRKGATRAFPAGHPDIPAIYRDIGQPVLIPGDMGRYSYVLVGTRKAMEQTFGSTCHGAGRVQSRSAARRSLRGSDVIQQLEARGITVKTGSMAAIAEEASQAYKDVAEVVAVTQAAGISRRVARVRPLGVVKG